jgi:hypothetical protein
MPKRKPPKSGHADCDFCGEFRRILRLGLCYICYYNPRIRKQYKDDMAEAEAFPTEQVPYPLPRLPTDAQPGSEDKIEVMALRVERKEALHHPKDCNYHFPRHQMSSRYD